MKTVYSIAQINSMTDEEFVHAIGPVFENSPWIAGATEALRPFSSNKSLHEKLCETVRASSEAQQLALIRAHPDLVGGTALQGTLTPESAREQTSAGLGKLSAEEIQQFQSCNAAYRKKFEFPFVICARLNKIEAILAGLEKRLRHSRETEIKISLEEIFKIAGLRLKDLVSED
ncbi:MAG: 2-oxo-4-hydroxy-4-carboxy-5-ureidoimidazoline decarboxylase [Verrucomicrobiota bacterium]